jgi:hypothetical protein
MQQTKRPTKNIGQNAHTTICASMTPSLNKSMIHEVSSNRGVVACVERADYTTNFQPTGAQYCEKSFLVEESLFLHCKISHPFLYLFHLTNYSKYNPIATLM